jgi:hypothetical protein
MPLPSSLIKRPRVSPLNRITLQRQLRRALTAEKLNEAKELGLSGNWAKRYARLGLKLDKVNAKAMQISPMNLKYTKLQATQQRINQKMAKRPMTVDGEIRLLSNWDLWKIASFGELSQIPTHTTFLAYSPVSFSLTNENLKKVRDEINRRKNQSKRS